jgi:hypothetical protein
MRASTAFFAGMGTVVVAIASGVSGGAWIADMMKPGLPKQAMETAHLHRQALTRRMSASGVVPYVAATLAFTDASIDHGAATQGQSQAKADVVKKQVSRPVQSAGTAEANGPSARDANAPSSKPVTEAARQVAARPPNSMPENAFARARDADLKRATESRKAPHRYWTSRHRYQPRAAQNQYKQQQSTQAGKAQGNSAQQARGEGEQRSPERTYSERRYPGGRYRAAGRRYHDESDHRDRQYDSGPRYAERPAPFPFQFRGLFGPD